MTQISAPSPLLNGGGNSNTDPGDLHNELQAAAQGRFAAELAHFAILEFEGEDALGFLQGQLSCDVAGLNNTARCSLGSYCTAKGRMLTSFLLWEHEGRWRMLLSRSNAAAIQKRLGMFVLRAKVRISMPADLTLIGLAGWAAIELKARAPEEPWMHDSFDRHSLLSLPGKRWIVCLPAAETPALWKSIEESQIARTGTAAWDWTDVRQGIPWIGAATQDHFVPQMTNLELIGGVSFKKGCYPGQEIVARTQYLGKVKRRMYLAHVPGPAEAGLEVYSDDVGGQANGMVVNAAPSPAGGSDMLVSVQCQSATNAKVHLGSPDGPVLEFLALPYSIV